ncbi:polycystic kidney disease 1 like 1 [Scomber scombrus]|uniref:Polycystic kidney disease 1 like 1 n=1 Tax=Scomber scombrus TaxID=13677 RepID=A0AAV1PIH4_SCOSC
MKEKDPSNSGLEDDQLHQAAWSRHNSGSNVTDKLRGRRILAVALIVSLWYRRRPDFHSFSSITDFEIETSILLDHNGANRPEEQFRPSALPQEGCSYLKKLLGARQRARYLRLMRPLTPAELRRTRRRKRRETLIHKSLRDLCVCVSMLFLMLCITFGSSFSDHYHLNKAVRKQFLGSDAVFRLKLLRSAGWLGRQTVALKVQFTLYSPAPNLFSSVTLLAEQSPTGALLPSAKVQSVRVYHTPAVWDYVVMICQLLFLLLSLLHLCLQVYTAGQQGLMGYCRTPCNWLEAILLTVTIVYYVHYIYHSVVIMEVVELLQRHNYREHVDVSLLATWEQMTGVVSSLVRSARRSQSCSDVFTIRELSSCIRQRVSEFTGHHRPTRTDNNAETRTYYLEEFESLVDELLFRLNALSNSLHHMLPPKDHRYREDSPVSSLMQEPSDMDSQSFRRTEQMMVNDHTDVNDDGESPPVPQLLRSQLELEILQLPAHRGQKSDSPKQSGTTSEEHSKSTVWQPYFKGRNGLSLPESSSPTGLWMAEHPQSRWAASQSGPCNVLEMQSSQYTKTSNSCWFSTSGRCRTEGPTATQATHTEVVVEVLVHEEPGSV